MKVTQLKQEIIDGKGKQQELLTQILANAGNKDKEYVDQLLSKFGLDVEGLLFRCDQETQQQIIESLNQEDREKLHEEIKQFDLNEVKQYEEQPAQSKEPQIIFDPESQQYVQVVEADEDMIA